MDSLFAPKKERERGGTELMNDGYEIIKKKIQQNKS